MTTILSNSDINVIVDSYIEVALWSSIQENGQAFDDDFDNDDVSNVSECRADVIDFLQAVDRDGYLEQLLSEHPLANIGHDFWLTRNGHGTGFWDNDISNRNEISDIARSFGNAYVFEDADYTVCIES